MTHPWHDPALSPAERAEALLAAMTLEEKLGQLASFWAMPSEPGAPVAPMEEPTGRPGPVLSELAKAGLGQLTRVYGTAPVTPREGLERLAALQGEVTQANRFALPAIVHEECLTGFMTHGATVYPSPLAWGATFHPELIEAMAARIGETMRRAGVHQGLAPVLDVVRDYRWGRTEECIGEDPHLVATIGAAYVTGLEKTGIIATLKHFAGYSASRAGRNMAPAAIGPRELADVVIEPFELALREGGARSVMHAYTDTDGIPAAADERLLTGLLRGELGFGGTVVADYFGIAFLHSRHGVAATPGEAAALALRAGVDVELPTLHCYGDDLRDLVTSGAVSEELVDRAALRVLSQKAALGLLDADWAPPAPEDLDFDPPAARAIAGRIAEESIVVLANDGTLPLRPARVAVLGRHAGDPRAFLGCYAFPNHVGTGGEPGVAIPTLTQALTGAGFTIVDACDAEVNILVVGDKAGLFGRGTSGEGCDADTLELPDGQAAYARSVLDSATPTILVVLSGRPYALGDLAWRAAAVVQVFFPGEEGGPALARILSGAADPAGRLPVSVPRSPGGQPGTYLRPALAGPTDWSSVDPTPLYPFGHGLTWTTFGYAGLTVTPEAATDGTVRISAEVTNTGEAAGTEVVQLYLSDPVASVVRPTRWLAGYRRVRLAPGEGARVTFVVHADRCSFTGADLRRVVEPGEIGVAVGSSSGDLPLTGSFRLTGPARYPGAGRVLTVPTTVTEI